MQQATLVEFARAFHADGSPDAIRQLKKVMQIAEDAANNGVSQVDDSISLDFLPARSIITKAQVADPAGNRVTLIQG
jgi:hypothetical protein